MVRTELREHIFKMLFQIEFNTLEEMPKHLELYFEELTSAKEKDKEYIQKAGSSDRKAGRDRCDFE
jgi:N utilization substance protein B